MYDLFILEPVLRSQGNQLVDDIDYIWRARSSDVKSLMVIANRLGCLRPGIGWAVRPSI